MTNYIIGIYKSDERYKENPWTIIDTNNDEYKGVILIHLVQGNSNATGHYSGIRLNNNHFLGIINVKSFQKANKEKNNLLDEDIDMTNLNELKTLIFNCRSRRDYHKKYF